MRLICCTEKRNRYLATVAFCAMMISSSILYAEDGFVSIFNGQDLDGWRSMDTSYFSVEEGAITAESTEAHPLNQNLFLVWEGGDVDDFELKLKFRIFGGPTANSGVQFRCGEKEDGHLFGYQADIDRGVKWLGCLYDEHMPRKLLANRGERVSIARDGERTTEVFAGSAELLTGFDPEEWNEYHIIAQGHKITIKVNGKTTIELDDREEGEAELTGLLALQIHSGPAMKVQFKEIHLKRTQLTDGRKKISFVAGAPSHASGEHEFNAGVKLLTRRLNAIPGLIVTSYYDHGWPKDPTAFDNADAIIFYNDGGGRHPILEHLAEIDQRMKQGVGLMCMHYAVEVPTSPAGDFFQRWIGGFYEGGYSTNPHWKASLNVAHDHEVGQGVEAQTINDEWYFNIRFLPAGDEIVEFLSSTPTEANMTVSRKGSRHWNDDAEKQLGQPQTVMWGLERADGGRGVGFTGGHFHRNWANDDFRKIVLNACLWVARCDVPANGVESESVSEEEINLDLDPKKSMTRIKLGG